MELRASSGLLTAAFVSLLVCLASPQQAHAGFGRGGGHGGGGHGGGHSGGGHSGGSSHSSSGFGRSSGSGYYPSRGYRTFRSGGGSYRSYYPGGYYTTPGWGWNRDYGYPLYPSSWGYPTWGYGFGYVPSYPLTPPAMIVDGQPLAAEEAYNSQPAIATAVAADVMGGANGPLLGALFSVEGERLGFVLGYTAAFPPIGRDSDTLHLATAHLTYAFFSSERVRLRAEAGLHLAVAPLATFLAPGVGLSAAVGIAGPLGLEGRVYANAWPFTQVDARTGLTLSFAGIGLGAGVRALYLNDNGALGDVNAGDTSDTFVGPYATLAIAL